MKMNYYLCMGLAAALALTSCSKDDNDRPEVPGEKGSAINFGYAFVNNSSRGEVNTGNLDAMKVYGFVNTPETYIFDNTTVTKDGNSWTYPGSQYWYNGNTYYFTALAPTDDDAGWTFSPLAPENNSTPYVGGGSLTFDTSREGGDTDLVYAFYSVTTPADGIYNRPVKFVFNHILSQVRFRFINNMSDGTQLRVKNVRLDHVVNAGTIDLNTKTPAWVTVADNYTAINADIDGDVMTLPNANVTGETEGNFIIPAVATAEPMTLSFTVEVYNGNSLMATYNHNGLALPTFDMNMGYCYNYNAAINAGNVNPDGGLNRIEFEVDKVNDWTDEEVGTPVLP